jgi:nucleotide-binding universal stress UspA family protein
MYRHVLVPTDGSALSTTAVQNAMAFARDAGAKVTVLTVLEPFQVFSMDSTQLSDTKTEYEAHARQAGDRSLAEAGRAATALGVPHELVQVMHALPWKAIIDTATEKGCDLVAMASHGRRGAAALLLGSETVKVLTHSTIPVLVFR